MTALSQYFRTERQINLLKNVVPRLRAKNLHSLIRYFPSNTMALPPIFQVHSKVSCRQHWIWKKRWENRRAEKERRGGKKSAAQPKGVTQ